MEAIAKSKVSVYTGSYKCEYGKEPRGYGEWAFGYTRNPNIDDLKWYHGTYAEAKKQAIAEAAATGHRSIYVQP